MMKRMSSRERVDEATEVGEEEVEEGSGRYGVEGDDGEEERDGLYGRR